MTMKQPFERILITAALPYANGFLHLGHLAGAYLPADIYARYQRLKKRNVLFVCGSDEHGVAITVSAEKEKTTPKEIIDRYHPANKSAFELFEMSFDNYSRTSIPQHHETTKEFFKEFHSRDIVVAKKDNQLYCEKDKKFLADRYVEGTCPKCKSTQARGDQCENCGTWLNQSDLIEPKCKLCGTTPVMRETKHWYFPLGKYQERLVAYIDERNKRDGWKDNVLRYCESWFKDGLQDRAVTRDLNWGVQVPVEGYEDKVIYVWFDAVLGYITSAKEWAAARNKPDAWKEFWQKEDTKYVAFIGKDNVVFHCIVFPSMLMAWNDAHTDHYVLPENVPANEFLNFEGQKFSKSRGWGIDVQDFLKFFPADMLRYALAVNLPETRDSDFYLKDFQARINNELADIVGNFVNRTLAFTDKNFEGKVPPMGKVNARDEEMIGIVQQTPVTTGELFEQYRFREGLMEVMNFARAANKYFNDNEPWKTLKTNPERCATTLHMAIQIVRSLAILLEPVTPAMSAKIWKLLNLGTSSKDEGWDSASILVVKEGHQLNKPEILINKIEDAKIDEIIKFLEGEEKPPAAPPLAPMKPIITLDDFKKVDLRVARIIEAIKMPKSEKLLKLQVEIGNERRQVVAGIAKQYKPEELIGKLVVVVANLQAAKLMGQESQGMILAASDESGNLTLVGLQSEITTGASVK
jgi:methionyl-tRNA synthetase